MSSKGKRPLVLFSGGLDSTYLLHNLLASGEDVDVLYIDGGQGKAKIDAEKQAVAKLLKLFDAWHQEGHFEGRIRSRWLEGKFTYSDAGSFEKMSLQQVLPWLSTALQYAHPDRCSRVCIAYCLGDSVSAWLDKIQQAWTLLYSTIYYDQLVPLEFPLKQYDKQFFLRYLPSALRNETWVCELPVQERRRIGKHPARWKACGKCPACLRSAYNHSLISPVKATICQLSGDNAAIKKPTSTKPRRKS